MKNKEIFEKIIDSLSDNDDLKIIGIRDIPYNEQLIKILNKYKKDYSEYIVDIDLSDTLLNKLNIRLISNKYISENVDNEKYITLKKCDEIIKDNYNYINDIFRGIDVTIIFEIEYKLETFNQLPYKSIYIKKRDKNLNNKNKNLFYIYLDNNKLTCYKSEL